MNREELILTGKEIQRIRKATAWAENNRSNTQSEPLEVCDCREEKILIKAEQRGAGFPEIIIEIMCMGCGRKFEGFVKENEDKAFFMQKIKRIKETYNAR